MKILLFGGLGFLGKEIYNLLNLNYEVILAPRNIDISDFNQLIKFNVKADVIINCAAKVPPASAVEMTLTNAKGVENLAKWSNNQISQFIHCSTLSVFQRPWNLTEDSNNYDFKSAYSCSKLMGEQKLLSIQPNATILRFSALYGSGMKEYGVIPLFLKKALNNEDITAETQVFADFLHIYDAAMAILLALKKGANGIFHIASGQQTSIYQLAELIVQQTNSNSKIIPINSAHNLAKVSIAKACQIGFNPQISLFSGIKGMI